MDSDYGGFTSIGSHYAASAGAIEPDTSPLEGRHRQGVGRLHQAGQYETHAVYHQVNQELQVSIDALNELTVISDRQAETGEWTDRRTDGRTDWRLH